MKNDNDVNKFNEIVPNVCRIVYLHHFKLRGLFGQNPTVEISLK